MTKYFIISYLILGSLVSSVAQTTESNGSIKGQIVSEQENKPVEFAHIFISETKSGATTDENGHFIIKNLANGIYSIAISFIGYETLHIDSVEIKNAQAIDLGKIVLKTNSISLSEIVISPGSYSVMEKAKSTSLMTLSEKDIKNMAWAEDVTRAVSRLPGISASDYSSKFAIRGGEAYQVLISLDGMELYEPFHQRDYSGGLFSIIDIEAIRGIDLMTGGFSAENGNRLSGVFGMKTKKQNPDQKNLSIGASIMNARIYTDGTFAKNKGSYLFSARRGMLDLTLKAIGNQEYFPKFYDGLTKVEYQLNDKHILTMHVLHAGDKAFIDNSPDGDEYDQYETKYYSTYGWLTLRSYYSNKLDARTILYSGNINHDRTGGFNKYDNSDKGSFSVNDQRTYTYVGVKQDWSWEIFEKLHLKWGFEAKRLKASYDYVNSIQEIRLDSNEQVYNFDRNLNIKMNPLGEQVGTFLTSRFIILPKLIAEAGVRYDYASYTNDKNWSPRASLVYAFTKKTFLRAG